MLPDLDGLVEITLNNSQLDWYTERGYSIPTETVQLWAKNKRGERVKNGVERRSVRGTKLTVRRSDLPPLSNLRLIFRCETCGVDYTTTWGAYRYKKTKSCKACVCAAIKTTGCHGYWVERLIANNAAAKCDMSGETDKRFLVLHHLLSRSGGGMNVEANYVILSANYHLAFHVWNGGTNVPCTPESYAKFKSLEMIVTLGMPV